MSESTSSPYVHLHPISPSSSLSSTDSAPRSEPTSDEQPDLGAFTTVLREWTHLQPPPRIPIQIRSATSSTTPTFQPEQSVVGSDFPSRSGRSRNSRLSTRSGMSGVSSFTRPPSSSIHPEGSTVWNHAPIALYLNSGTPSNDVISEDEEEYESREDGEYTPSPPNSPASTSLTVEIASEVDFPSFDGSQDSNRILLDSSPFPYHTDPGIAVAVPLEGNSQRLDSRETGHTEDGLRPPSSEGHGDHSSRTSRDFVRPGVTGGSYSVPSSQSQAHSHDQSQTGSSITSVQLQSQARAPTTTAMSSSDSLALPILVSTTTTSATRQVPSSTQALHSGNDATSVNSSTSTSTSTLINALLTRTWDPQPPRTTSDSSFMTGSASSSNLSLLSYQIPDTPPITFDEDSDRDQGLSSAFPSRPQPPRPQLPTNQFSSSSTSLPSTSSNSGSLSLKTQRSLLSSNSSSHSTTTLTAQRQQPLSRPFHSSSIPHASSLASNGSPLPNPYSPLPLHESDRPTNVGVEVRSSLGDSGGYITITDFGVVNDLGTPDQPPSETLLFEPPREMRAEFLPVDDDEDEEMRIESKPAPALPRFGRSDASLHKAQPSQTSAYSSGHDRPGPSGHRQPLSHRQPVVERTIHLEPQYDDDDDDYPYQYPYSHTPRSHAQAATPRGIPPRPEPSAPTSATQAEFPSQHRQVEFSSQPFSQIQPQTHNTLVQRDVDIQQISRPPMEPQPQSQNYSPTRINMQTQTVAPPPATQTQPQLSQKYPFGYAPAESSTTRLHASTQSTSFTQTQELASEGHGYRHSLLGLHALPASLVSPEPDDLPEFKPAVEPVTPLTAQPQLLVENDSTIDITRLEEVSKQELPSLGYLDEALSFIAAERARWSAARPSTSGTSGPSDSREVGDEAGSGEEGEGQEGEGEAEWKQVNDNDQDHPKRKRRRKRPPRSHGLPPGSLTAAAAADSPIMVPKMDGPADDSTGVQVTSSPKKKKRSKSASASTSSRSLLLESPSKTKAKAKAHEKEFLVPPPSISYSPSGGEKEKLPVTILRRPVNSQATAQVMSEEDVAGGSDKDGGRTPTNSGEVASGKEPEVGLDRTPINLVGKKGKRVGRKEREREKLKIDKAKSTGQGEGKVDDDHEAFDIEIEYDDDDDNVDDGVEPQDEDDDQEENDSLSNMSLLQPPRRKRDRSRRRKGKDTVHIHNLIGIGGIGSYKSTPPTPRKFKFDSGDAVDEAEEDIALEVKVEAENVADDVFLSKPDEAAVGEKKKRTRTKRKTLSHARSDPQLREAVLGDAAAVDEDSGDAAQAKPKKGKNKASPEYPMDILDMDRNQLQKHLSATSSSGSGLLSTLRPAETRAQPPPESKRGRLLALAKKLSQFFPEQREELGKVIARIEKQGSAPTTRVTKALSVDISANYGIAKSSPIAIPGIKRKRSRKGGHIRTGSEGTGGEVFDFDDDPVEAEHPSRGELVRFSGIDEEEEEIDPRGRPPKKSDVLIHVFIDHSNILIGLLSHLKRHPPQRTKLTATATRGRPLPTVLTKATTAAKVSDKSDPASAFAAVKSSSARPLPIPTAGETTSPSSSKRPQAVPVQKGGNYPIPLPSFATMSRSLPTGSVLGSYMPGKDDGRRRSPDETTDKHEKETKLDGHGYPATDNEDNGTVGPGSLFVGSLKNNKEKKAPKHLWHAALTLILERGRPITRRVVVTSSPLYQPMESIERLGYELRVFIRVPDLGDGMDRERHRDKDRSGSGKSSGGGKSAQSSPVTTTTLSGMTHSAKRDKSVGHARKISGNTSAESGSGGGAGSGNSGGGSTHPYNGNTNGSTPQTKVKYREQGVDELLQLKLHQALAATDDVPEGSTIVLATGDGNMGQFNEDGFLGPVRTALRRGWKVELYAWEDGLSRAWKREFGVGSEWGRKGMFQVIGMEQFASGLVEASDWL